MATPSKTPPGADPKQLERTGTVREIGSQAVWSLSSCKPGQTQSQCAHFSVCTLDHDPNVILNSVPRLTGRFWGGSAEGWQPGNILAVRRIPTSLGQHTVQVLKFSIGVSGIIRNVDWGKVSFLDFYRKRWVEPQAPLLSKLAVTIASTRDNKKAKHNYRRQYSDRGQCFLCDVLFPVFWKYLEIASTLKSAPLNNFEPFFFFVMENCVHVIGLHWYYSS